jgi:outer membrane murein-binding lipoprotein Lpp
MALAKTHQAFIEAELDRDIQIELDSRSQKKTIKAKNLSSSDADKYRQSEQAYAEKTKLEKKYLEQQPANKYSLFLTSSKTITTKIWANLLAVSIPIKKNLLISVDRQIKKVRRLNKKIKAKKVKREAMMKAVNVAKSESRPAPKLTAVDKINHLEHSIENSLDRGRNSTLHWIGVPSQSEFNELAKRVELLSEKVEFLEQELEESQAQNSVNRTIIA